VRVRAALTDEIARWLGIGTAEQMRAGTPAWAAEAEDLARSGRAFRYLVECEGRFAGAIEVRPDAVRGHVGYWLRRAERGKGTATRATRMVIPIAFEGLRLPAVDFTADSANLASIRVMERLGATRVAEYPTPDRSGRVAEVRYRLPRRRYRADPGGPQSLSSLLESDNGSRCA
jgi:RimJ/RimL family protein N-acetyltransferase